MRSFAFASAIWPSASITAFHSWSSSSRSCSMCFIRFCTSSSSFADLASGLHFATTGGFRSGFASAFGNSTVSVLLSYLTFIFSTSASSGSDTSSQRLYVDVGSDEASFLGVLGGVLSLISFFFESFSRAGAGAVAVMTSDSCPTSSTLMSSFFMFGASMMTLYPASVASRFGRLQNPRNERRLLKRMGKSSPHSSGLKNAWKVSPSRGSS
mmetsp:Transcript_48986/g.74512  ORF Transcript_48986/g.74512 Transcript_48986/m.74512 type:complete len:211 (-) Transcript_48986:102-734(-)